jgi:uncharacterized protein YjbI with pentapeptide repeats
MNILLRQPLRSGYTNLNDAKLQFAHLEGADLRGALLQGAKLNYAHLGKYIDRFQAEDKVDAEMEGCKPKSDGLINIISQPKEPSAAEICRWALCHPAQDDHIELPEHFSCHGYKNPWAIYPIRLFFPDCPENAENLLCSPIKHEGLPETLKHVLESAIKPAANLTGADLTGCQFDT